MYGIFPKLFLVVNMAFKAGISKEEYLAKIQAEFSELFEGDSIKIWPEQKELFALQDENQILKRKVQLQVEKINQLQIELTKIAQKKRRESDRDYFIQLRHEFIQHKKSKAFASTK